MTSWGWPLSNAGSHRACRRVLMVALTAGSVALSRAPRRGGGAGWGVECRF